MSKLIKVPSSVRAYSAIKSSSSIAGRTSSSQLSALQARAKKDWEDACPKDFYIALRVFSVYVYDVYGGASGGGAEESGMQELYMGGYMLDADGSIDKHVPGEFNTKQGGTYTFGGGAGSIMLKIKNPTEFVTFQLWLVEDDKHQRDAATALKNAMSDNDFTDAVKDVVKAASSNNPVAGAITDLATTGINLVLDLIAKNSDDYMGQIGNTEFASDFFGTGLGVLTQDTSWAKIKYQLELRTV
jgi:hypothetical protein